MSDFDKMSDLEITIAALRKSLVDSLEKGRGLTDSARIARALLNIYSDRDEALKKEKLVNYHSIYRNILNIILLLHTHIILFLKRMANNIRKITIVSKSINLLNRILQNKVIEEKSSYIKQRNNVVYKTALYNQARKAVYLYRQTLFAEDALRIGNKLSADVYLCLLPSSVPAGFALQDKFGGLVICDNVENVDVDRHTVAPVHPRPVVRLANHAAVGTLFACDKLMTIGNALAETLKRYQRPTLVLENFRNYEEVTPDVTARAEWDIPDDGRILFTCGSIVEGFDNVLRGLALLPESFHLVALCRFPVKAQEQQFRKLITELGISGRVHLKEFVPYKRLASVAANAHIGLIVNSVENPNASVGLPNRFFDFLTAELPVVATAMPDVARLIDDFSIGEVVHENTPETWHQKIMATWDNREALKSNVLNAKKTMSWETKEDDIYTFMERPKRVTMIAFRDLSRYQRFNRIARTLSKRGVKVNMLFFSKNPDEENLLKGVKYYYTDSMLLPDTPIKKLSSKA